MKVELGSYFKIAREMVPVSDGGITLAKSSEYDYSGFYTLNTKLIGFPSAIPAPEFHTGLLEEFDQIAEGLGLFIAKSLAPHAPEQGAGSVYIDNNSDLSLGYRYVCSEHSGYDFARDVEWTLLSARRVA